MVSDLFPGAGARAPVALLIRIATLGGHVGLPTTFASSDDTVPPCARRWRCIRKAIRDDWLCRTTFGEGTDAAVPGIEAGQTADQVDQQVLAQVVEIGGGQHHLAVQAARHHRGPGDQSGKVGGGNRRGHVVKPQNIIAVVPRLPLRRLLLVGMAWENRR